MRKFLGLWRSALTEHARKNACNEVMRVAGQAGLTKEFTNFMSWWSHGERLARCSAQFRATASFGLLANLSESANAALKSKQCVDPLVAARDDLGVALALMTAYKCGTDTGRGPTKQTLERRQAGRVASEVHHTVVAHLLADSAHTAVTSTPVSSTVLTVHDSHRSLKRTSQQRTRDDGSVVNTRTSDTSQTSKRLNKANEALQSQVSICKYETEFAEQAPGTAGAALLQAVTFTIPSTSNDVALYQATICRNPKCNCPDFFQNGTFICTQFIGMSDDRIHADTSCSTPIAGQNFMCWHLMFVLKHPALWNLPDNDTMLRQSVLTDDEAADLLRRCTPEFLAGSLPNEANASPHVLIHATPTKPRERVKRTATLDPQAKYFLQRLVPDDCPKGKIQCGARGCNKAKLVPKTLAVATKGLVQARLDTPPRSTTLFFCLKLTCLQGQRRQTISTATFRQLTPTDKELVFSKAEEEAIKAVTGQ
jgi:hypothetical protein